MAFPPDGLVRAFDYHPGEPSVRVFAISGSGVLRLDDVAFVSETRIGSAVLRHYAFADEWFTVNATLDLVGTPIETPPGADHPAFAFNCDIATPMRREGPDVLAVDLFADVLVGRDGRTYHVKDEDDLDGALRTGLASPHDFALARAGLARLVSLIVSGGLIPFLDDVHPFGPSHDPEGPRFTRSPVEDVPQLQPHHRWT
ncbi:MAG TPA: DUF402 domain-containing protein [Thermomicrobiales bacterium]|nr:DUF402 domain-containing protein [Thermomicrobiales bacterium]